MMRQPAVQTWRRFQGHGVRSMYISIKNSAAILLLFTGMMLSVTDSMATTPTAATDSREQQIQQAGVLEKYGRKAMSYIAAARQLLSKQHNEEAHQYLKKARELLTTLKSKITTEKDNVTGTLSIYSQLGVKKEVGITKQLRQKLENTHLDVIRGKHEKVIAALKNIGVELQYSFVDLPVAATLGKVESALKSLSAKNIRQARKILTDAEAGLIRDHVIINASAKTRPDKHADQHTEYTSQGVI